MKNYRNRVYPHLVECAVYAAVVLVSVLPSFPQTAPQSQPGTAFSEDLKKYPGLLPELGQLIDDLKHDVKYPAARSESALLPLLPAGTTYYVAFPNYGEVARQSLATLNQHLQSSAVLHDWWQHGELSSAGPKIQEFLHQFDQLFQYLGYEIVVCGETGGKNRGLLVLAQVRKPGLREFLKEMWKQNQSEMESMRVFDAQELAIAKPGPAQQLTVLVRPDYVIVAQNVEALRSFNSYLDGKTKDAKTKDFPSTEFGQRLGQAYRDGVSVLMAADLHTILHQNAGNKQSQEVLQRSGFSDTKYAVWEYNHGNDKSGSIGELSFTAPRRSAASWLAAPAPMGSLDFVSPQTALVGSTILKNLGDIYSDIQYLASASNPQAFAMVTPMEQAMHISLKDDLLALFPGEVAFELQRFLEPKPEWKAILRVSDAQHLQATLQTMFTSMQYKTMQFEEDGVTYYSVTFPPPQNPTHIVYTFVDGYLLVAPSHELITEAIKLHKSGESLAKSMKLQETLPAGYPADASALWYEDPSTIAAMNLRRFSPDMAAAFTRIAPPTAPFVFRAYGEDTAIRAVSTSGSADPSMLLIVAAIAIPNLLRARIAANDASAVANVRTIDTAQVSYYAAYPKQGFARDLASLGPDPGGPSLHSDAHAGMIDETLGDSKCTPLGWCVKSGYRFRLTAQCESIATPCTDFVVTASPVSSSSGTRNFCSTSDGVVRFKLGAPLTDPVTVNECRKWAPVP